MDVLVCPDKFKGSLTAMQVCEAIKAGILRCDSGVAVICHPMSDGGDGMLDVLAETLGLEIVSVAVRDPLFRTITAEYGISPDGSTAFVEMARASGLVLLDPGELDCRNTTSFGTGELILDALRRGIRRVILGIGGSATNDGGIGVAAALGFRFLDAAGRDLRPVGKNLSLVDTIDASGVEAELGSAEFVVASDVQNPLFGPQGAARTFARQKGADAAAIGQLDEGMASLAAVIREKWGIDLQDIPGSGAAGGLGGGAVAFLGARLTSGVDLMIDATRLEERIAKSDLVVTGEGRLDEQTLGGKLIDGIIRRARIHDKKVAVLCGSSSLSATQVHSAGISYCGSIMDGGRSLQDAMRNAARYLEDSAFTMFAEVTRDG